MRRQAIERLIHAFHSTQPYKASIIDLHFRQLSSLKLFSHHAPKESFSGYLAAPLLPNKNAAANSSSLSCWCASTSSSLRFRPAVHGPSQHFAQIFQARCVSSRPERQGQTAEYSQRQAVQGKTLQQGLYLVALVVGMVGLTYASVPLYRMFCQATGYGGTVQQGSTVEEKLRRREESADSSLEAAAAARDLTVSFNADVTDGLNWRFMPTQRSVRLAPGESTLAFYTAHNLSDKAITGVSTYNVSPQQAGAYFNKIQCFCFEEQKLRAGEKVDMPVFFYIDPEFATDPRMKGIDHLTLSYTFFKVAEDDGPQDRGGAADQRTDLAVQSR